MGNVVPFKLSKAGLKMYSVTTVTSPYFYEMMRLSGVKEETYGYASEKGTLVHKACQCYALSLLSIPLPPEYEGYSLSFIKWFDRYVEEVIWTEKELVDEDLGFYGHPDMLVRLKGQDFLSLPDIKTPTTYSPLWKLQLSAYHHLIAKSGGEVPAWCGSIMLNKDGKMPRAIEHQYAVRDFVVFLEALDVWRFIFG